MNKSTVWWVLLSVLMVSAMVLSACKPAGTATPSPEELAQQVANTQMARATEMAVATLVMRVTELSMATNTPMPTSTPQPTATPQPTIEVIVPTQATTIQPTTAPATGDSPKAWAMDGKCYFQLQYLGDENYPPDSIVKANEKFTKSWRVKNTGTCPWESNLYNVDLHFEGGNQMGNQGVFDISASAVEPGDTATISIALTAPATAGTYTGYWMPRAEGNVRFGYGDKNQYSLAVRIIVN